MSKNTSKSKKKRDSRDLDLTKLSGWFPFLADKEEKDKTEKDKALWEKHLERERRKQEEKDQE